MRMIEGLRSAVFNHVKRRFASPSARFSTALSTGFVIATVGMATVSIDRAGHAQDVLAEINSFFGVSRSAPVARQPYALTYERPRYRAVEHARRRRRDVAASDSRRHAVGTASASASPASSTAPVRLGRASICVRLCDGFAFPVGDFHGQGDVAAHEATCRSECPGARTALYVLPTGSSLIDEALDAHTGATYSQKASGFHYTTYIEESCSCHPREGNRISSLLHDYTLRRGDAVMTAKGVKVFHGGAHFPFRQADFVRLAQSRDVEKAARDTFREIERASVTSSHPAVAQDRKHVPDAAGLESLEHQAANYSLRP